MQNEIDLDKNNQIPQASNDNNTQHSNSNSTLSGMDKVTKWDNIGFSDSYQLAGFWLRFCANFISGQERCVFVYVLG